LLLVALSEPVGQISKRALWGDERETLRIEGLFLHLEFYMSGAELMTYELLFGIHAEPIAQVVQENARRPGDLAARYGRPEAACSLLWCVPSGDEKNFGDLIGGAGEIVIADGDTIGARWDAAANAAFARGFTHVALTALDAPHIPSDVVYGALGGVFFLLVVTLQTSLGYFINPLITVLVGVVVLHETLSRTGWIAVGLAGAAVAVLTISYGRLPYIALILAFFTAFSYSELARIYPQAGTASAYYFAEKAFVDKEETAHHRWARIAKLATGWAAHLFYWVYPGVMVAFMAILIQYILGAFGVTIGMIPEMIIAIAFAILVGYIAYRGVSGSTMTALIINVIQLTALILFSVGAVWSRLANPAKTEFVWPSAASVIVPKDLLNTLMQATIAILILVGFESCTAFAAEAKNPKRDIPRAVIIALVVQGLFAYLIEYFAANFATSSALTGTAADGSTVTGLDAAAASSAPMGDLIQVIGDRVALRPGSVHVDVQLDPVSHCHPVPSGWRLPVVDHGCRRFGDERRR